MNRTRNKCESKRPNHFFTPLPSCAPAEQALLQALQAGLQQHPCFVMVEGFTMPITAKSLSEPARQLPPEDRPALVDPLLDTLDEPDASLDAIWAKEAESRLAAYRKGEVQATALSDVISRYSSGSHSA